MGTPVRTARTPVVSRVLTHSHRKPQKNVCSHHTAKVITGNNGRDRAITGHRRNKARLLRISCEVMVIMASDASVNAEKQSKNG